MVLYLPRPFQLGFYHDDWEAFAAPAHATAAFSAARLHWFLGPDTTYSSRPLGGVVAFLVSSVFGTSAWGFQSFSILLVLLCALSLRSWLNLILAVFPFYRSLAADLATVFWMSIPWMLGVTAWPIVAQSLAAQIFFTEAARLLLRHRELTPKLAAQFTITLLASGLVYEAFYFAVFLVIVFYAIYRRGLVRNARQLVWLLSLSSLAQAILIAFNRYSASIGSGTKKQFMPGWVGLFWNNLRGLPNTLAISLGEYSHVWAILLAVFAIGSLLALLGAALLRRAMGRYLGHLLGIVTVAGVMLLASDVTYSVAGYGFTSVGVPSRALFSASLSVAVGFFALCSCWMGDSARYWKAVGGLAASAVIVVTALGQRERIAEWAHVWQQEREILSVAPVEQIGGLPQGSAVWYIGPTYYKGIVIFGAVWDLTGAVFSENPLKKGHPYDGTPAIFPSLRRSKAAWDGATLLWELPGHWRVEVPVKHLYVWKLGKPILEEASAGFSWPPKAAAKIPGN
jgi:hypothetical protein